METYLKAYLIKNSYDANNDFVSQTQIVSSDWVKENNQYVKLEGDWHKPGLTAVFDNYFVIKKVGEVDETCDLHSKLYELSKKHMNDKYPNEGDQIIYVASDTSFGYEYPILTSIEEEEIQHFSSKTINYASILRYAYASSYIYHSGSTSEFNYFKDENFKELMLFPEKEDLEILMAKDGSKNTIKCVAIKVPAVEKYNLPEEIIISFKGTDSLYDVWEDVKLMLQNFSEKNVAWQQQSYDFIDSVIKQYPPDDSSIQSGFKKYKNGKLQMTITGHSLGAYFALMASSRLGINCRVFSGPATKLIINYPEFFSNSIFRNNSINFYTLIDAVVHAGRHNENMIRFSANRVNVHGIDAFIDNVIYPNFKGKVIVTPRNVYINSTATLGSGLNKRTNRWDFLI